ncbi:MAG: hypothetical protein M1160_02805 [Candidatus Marsarchaeota archaeon]|jgi:hypothetical protein|nr:hypothetical protein [Candidatus Marsarchaeota archaeon]MCL5111783.1 hypothetical protein [Candidatus Marsarchaeota archaeon]
MERKIDRCIICNEQKPGLEIAPDSFISAVRWLNEHTMRYKNPYNPVVCRQCFTKYRKARKSFERKRIYYLTIGILFAGVLVAASRLNPYSVLVGLGVVALMYLLSLVSYMPRLELPQAQRPARQ